MAENAARGPMGLNPMAGMLDSMDMIKRAWSSFNLPASLAPTIDPQELERRIKDLKTVEQWLSVNMGILQSSIQALEAQRNTILAMQAFGSAIKPAAPDTPAPQAGSGADDAQQAATNGPGAAANPAAWWDLLQAQFEQVAKSALGVSAALAGGPGPAAGGASGPAPSKRGGRASGTRSRKARGA